ncbi:MAG: hypothetical protein D6715_13300 [Calditrichaeota bacterium]|nr:MAG: hypothetical protein D6715_13300 [Calditrichota bacterium]
MWLLFLFLVACAPRENTTLTQNEDNPYREKALELLQHPPLPFKVRAFLAEKYRPGNCYGMPGPMPESYVNLVLKDNPVLVEFIKLKYKIRGKHKIFDRLIELLSIHLEPAPDGFLFRFTDANCCDIAKVLGRVVIENDEIVWVEILKKTHRKVPC